jgi:hypothetical protein
MAIDGLGRLRVPVPEDLLDHDQRDARAKDSVAVV